MVRAFLKELIPPLKIDKCYKCPFVEEGRCYGYNEDDEQWGRKLSTEVYRLNPPHGGFFTDYGTRDKNCPLPVQAGIIIEGV